MASFREVVETVGARFRIVRDGGHEVAVEVPLEGGRAQRVLVTHHDLRGRDVVELRSAFGHASRVGAEEVLKMSLDLPIGGLALHGDTFVVVDKTPFEGVDAQLALFLVEAVARTADELEKSLGGDRF